MTSRSGAKQIHRVTVLMGGASAEREVSLNSGKAAGKALTEAGFHVTTLDVGRDPADLVRELVASKPDVVFNALHGRFGEDGCVQGVLNLLGIPYTHSGLLASAAAMDKAFARRLFEQAGIPVAKGEVVKKGQATSIPRPHVVKPLNEGSSVGVYILHPGDTRDPLKALDAILQASGKGFYVLKDFPTTPDGRPEIVRRLRPTAGAAARKALRITAKSIASWTSAAGTG